MTINNRMTKNSLKAIEKIVGHQLTLGKLLWAIRQADEVSQLDFAEQLGMSKQQLCDIEHDRKSISPRLAASYAEKLGYSKEQFVRLALQEMVDREGLEISVEVFPKSAKRKSSFGFASAGAMR